MIVCIACFAAYIVAILSHRRGKSFFNKTVVQPGCTYVIGISNDVYASLSILSVHLWVERKKERERERERERENERERERKRERARRGREGEREGEE